MKPITKEITESYPNKRSTKEVKGDGKDHAWMSAWFDFNQDENHL